mmetsp:Transcript_36575/g.79832  ORF Transcript_36575/g.79832 Transcript_36575/m.79832 type:complete len:215 (+) Transcript_36575:426-1070(+)
MSWRKYSIFGNTVSDPSTSSMQAARTSLPAMYSSTTTRESKLKAYSIAAIASSSRRTSVMPRELSSLHGFTTNGTRTVGGYSVLPFTSKSPFGTLTPDDCSNCLVVALSVAGQIVYSWFPKNGMSSMSNNDRKRVMPSTQNMCGTITSGFIFSSCATAAARDMGSAAARAFSCNASGKLQEPSLCTWAKRNSKRVRSSSWQSSQALAYRRLRSW